MADIAPSRLSIVGVTLLVPRPAKPDNSTSYLHGKQNNSGDLLVKIVVTPESHASKTRRSPYIYTLPEHSRKSIRVEYHSLRSTIHSLVPACLLNQNGGQVMNASISTMRL
ncbi:hypothetical protein PCASD_24296 [Puccinia coronata f. sp. avenae]|uniref:Uncharacterized protein n=1 Tax=Puccinia coronata f. sp. avenae TaxID=200324 RepID=A0A2N5TU59_9BASI|nr:hypothetical protein PCASD_24296 [Puccinia coronata f. sp. avenae]